MLVKPLIKEDFCNHINFLTTHGDQFVLLIDFEVENYILCPITDLSGSGMYIAFPNFSFLPEKPVFNNKIHLEPICFEFESYKQAFDEVYKHLLYGDSYLLNLTFSIPVRLDVQLLDVFINARSKYKIYLQDRFICFSPETFIRIIENNLYTYPMKGTINANIPNAVDKLLNDEKEISEHYTVVDLLRNDLSMVAKRVRVNKFRYIESIHTNRVNLLQTSSEISGILPDNWKEIFAEILLQLLPAGSVSGAPKQKTTNIIAKVEKRKRGFYTGVALYFDGNNVDSCVMIRFIEKVSDGFVYQAGGGLTTRSSCKEEYQEILNKIYVPIF